MSYKKYYGRCIHINSFPRCKNQAVRFRNQGDSAFALHINTRTGWYGDNKWMQQSRGEQKQYHLGQFVTDAHTFTFVYHMKQQCTFNIVWNRFRSCVTRVSLPAWYGKKAFGLARLPSSAINLSGLNESGSCQYEGSVWIAHCNKTTMVPFGTS